jgi:hypothetical protein
MKLRVFTICVFTTQRAMSGRPYPEEEEEEGEGGGGSKAKGFTYWYRYGGAA